MSKDIGIVVNKNENIHIDVYIHLDISDERKE